MMRHDVTAGRSPRVEGGPPSQGMFFIGIDLAFSPKNNSGIAVLHDSLGYVTSALAKSDEDIIAAIRPYLVPGQTVVAVDAPLLVPNASGMRECERSVGRKFGGRGAAAYPAHQGNMAGTRGPGLLRRLESIGLALWTEPRPPVVQFRQ